MSLTTPATPPPRPSLFQRMMQVPPGRPGDLQITEELGPRGRRVVAGITALSLGALGLALWWMYRRLSAPSRFYEGGQLDGQLWWRFRQFSTSWRTLLEGLTATLAAALPAMAAATLIGVIMAALRHRGGSVSRRVATGYVEFFRACALILLIATPFKLIDFPDATLPLLPGRINMRSYLPVVIGLTLYYSTTIAEVVRSALRDLPRGQEEASQAIGLTKTQSMTAVLIPQALRNSLPNVVGQAASLLKDTSLGFIVLFQELLQRSQNLGKSSNTDLVCGEYTAAISAARNAGIEGEELLAQGVAAGQAAWGQDLTELCVNANPAGVNLRALGLTPQGVAYDSFLPTVLVAAAMYICVVAVLTTIANRLQARQSRGRGAQ